MSTPTPDPVVVVGLGPVGATVALLLAGQGVRVVAIERDEAVYPHPRAVALDDEALRVLHAAGVLDDGLGLRSAGTVRLRGRDGEPLVELPPPPTTTGHPALAFFRQPELEGLLRARLGREPLVEVRLGVELARVAQDEGGATVVVRRPGRGGGPGHGPRRGPRRGGEEQTLRASYVLACDGGRSGIRRALGVRLVGRTSGQRWLVVDTAAPGPAADGGRPSASAPPACTDLPEGSARPSGGPPPAGPARPAAPVAAAFAPEDFEFACDPRRPWVHGPLPRGEHRWEFLLGPGEESAVVERSGVVADLLGARLGGPAPAVRRAAVYVFHARVAARWRIGRVLLLGDAAHLAPPFAGQGLGAGLRDAHNLAWKVAAVVRGEAGEALLDSYAVERRPHVVRMTALAEALGAVVQLRRGRTAALRDRILRALVRRAGVRAWIAGGGWKPPSTIRRGVVAAGPHGWRAGEPLPQAPGALPVGPGWTVVRGGAGAPGDLTAWLAPAALALVRPDGVVFGTASADGEQALRGAAARALGGGASTRGPATRGASTRDPSTRDPSTRDPSTRDPSTRGPATPDPEDAAGGRGDPHEGR